MHLTDDKVNFRGTALGERTGPIRLGGTVLGPARHICAFFNSRDDEYRVLLPFIKDGFECGEKALHILGPDQRDEHLRRLVSAGIDARAAQQSGQLELHNWKDTDLPHGSLDQDRILASLEDVVERARQEGFPLTRIIGHVEWALENQADIEDLLEYEARANYVWLRHNDPVICTYDLAKFGGAIVVDIMRTHPLVIIGGILQENPFFVPPDEFLRELRERRLARIE